MDFLERFMGVVERLSDLGVDVLATVARCNKIQVDADKKTWLGVSGREGSARENKHNRIKFALICPLPISYAQCKQCRASRHVHGTCRGIPTIKYLSYRGRKLFKFN